MRSALWFGVVVLAVTVLVVAHLTNHALSSADMFPLDARQVEYQEETRRVIERLVAASKRHATEQEMENIRKEHREVTKRFYDYNKTRER
jgi:hypothetical protein